MPNIFVRINRQDPMPPASGHLRIWPGSRFPWAWAIPQHMATGDKNAWNWQWINSTGISMLAMLRGETFWDFIVYIVHDLSINQPNQVNQSNLVAYAKWKHHHHQSMKSQNKINQIKCHGTGLKKKHNLHHIDPHHRIEKQQCWPNRMARGKISTRITVRIIRRQ